MRRGPGKRPRSDNPDLDEVYARNAETCDCPDAAIHTVPVAVGSGMPGVIGCHMEQRDVCSICGRDATGIRLARHFVEMMKANKVKF